MKKVFAVTAVILSLGLFLIPKSNAQLLLGHPAASMIFPNNVTVNGNLAVLGTLTPTATAYIYDSLTINYGINMATAVITNTGATALTVDGGITAGTGVVGIVDATGKIPAISSTYFASLSGANLTGIPAAGITGTAATLAANTFTGLQTAPNETLTYGISAATGVFSGAVSIAGIVTLTGNEYKGAANYVSTFTASSGAQNWTGDLNTLGSLSVSGTISGPTSITGTKLIASGAGSVGLYSRSAAQIVALTPAAVGQVYYCNDCGTVPMCISTNTAQGGFALITNKTSVCQ
jgi:hypothetical protein